jgi:hypothetical protein
MLSYMTEIIGFTRRDTCQVLRTLVRRKAVRLIVYYIRFICYKTSKAYADGMCVKKTSDIHEKIAIKELFIP